MKLKAFSTLITRLIALGLVSVVSIHTAADQLIVYPGKNQSVEQQKQDKADCSIWADENSGLSAAKQQAAAAAPSQTAPPPRRGGAVRGALGGAAIGAIVGDSDSAAKGAGAGAVLGRMRQSGANREDERVEQQAKNQSQQQIAAVQQTYDKSLAACLEGRGYTVK